MLSMNLVSLPDGRIVNLDYLTRVEQAGDYVVLHFTAGGEGGSIIRVKQGEGARRVWAFIAGKCTQKIPTPTQQ
jgi:hypothetical protein